MGQITLQEEPLAIPILWIDDALIVVNKPSGLLTIRDGYDPQLPYLSALLSQQIGRCWVVHRLDKETSGVIVLARTPEAHRQLNGQFEQRQVTKTYHALIGGQPDWDRQTIDLTLRVNGDRRHRTVVDPQKGKPAATQVEVLERFQRHALVAAMPHTGYTHQIRAHLNAIGFPILGDSLYPGDASHAGDLPPSLVPPSLQRLGLHARLLQLVHPISQAPLAIEAPYYPDFEEALAWLRNAAAP